MKKEKECKHRECSPSWDHTTCSNCGKIKTDNGSSWGVAADKWFNSIIEAEFYKKNGRYPE